MAEAARNLEDLPLGNASGLANLGRGFVALQGNYKRFGGHEAKEDKSIGGMRVVASEVKGQPNNHGKDEQ